jgi:hypothetical protein
MGRSEGQESDHPKDDERSDDTSSRITKCETHIDNHVYHSWWRVSDDLRCAIAGLRACSPEADESRRSSGCRFCVAATIETVRQRQTFPRIFQSYLCPILERARESEEFEACETILLMDNCSPYMSDDIVVVFTRVRVRIIIFAFQTTHIFQILNAWCRAI